MRGQPGAESRPVAASTASSFIAVIESAADELGGPATSRAAATRLRVRRRVAETEAGLIIVGLF